LETIVPLSIGEPRREPSFAGNNIADDRALRSTDRHGNLTDRVSLQSPDGRTSLCDARPNDFTSSVLSFGRIAIRANPSPSNSVGVTMTKVKGVSPRRRSRLGVWLWFGAVTQMVGAGVVASASQSSGVGNSGADPGSAGASQSIMQLQEVVVTAQKRKQRLQNVPISMAVVSGPQLDASTVRVSDILNTLPGVAILKSYQGGGTLVMVRGVSAGEALLNGAGTVAYYIDSMPFGLVKEAIAPDTDAYDMSRIEVLKGPQGTLYGANALDGVVRVLTNDANLQEFEIKGRVSGSSTQAAGGNYRVDTAVNVPLIKDKLALRAVVGYQDESGWIDTSFMHDFNDARLRNLRLKIDAQPTEALSIGLSVWNSRDVYGAPSVGDTPRFDSAIFPEPIHNGYTTSGLNIAYQVDSFSISSATSYLDYSSNSELDFTPFLSFPSVLGTNIGSRVFSEEVRAVSSEKGNWRWVLGDMYRKATETLGQDIPQLTYGIDYVDESKSDAVYGEVSRLLLDGRLELTGGLRYFHDDISQSDQTGFGAPFVPGASTAAATTPRAVVTWHARKNLMVYASYSEGFRSGFPQNAPANVLSPAQPDLLKNYELGSKGTFLDGRLISDMSVYYMDWEHVQQNISVTVNGLPYGGTINGQSASGQGFDLDVTLAPIEGLTVSGSFSWNNLHMDSNVYSGGALLYPEGGRLNFSAKYTASASVGYTFPLGTGGFTGHVGLDGNYVSRLDNTVLLGGAVLTGRGDPLFTSRARLSIASTSNWTTTLFVDNLNNYQEAPFWGYGNIPQYEGRVRPRTVGLQLSFQY
jgi:iron complex outermembrane recepter protein